MPTTLAAPLRSDLVRSLDKIRPTAAKVPDQRMVDIIRAALLRHYGTVKEMAYALGQVDPSLMNREFDAGKLARVDQYADPVAKAAISRALAETYGTTDSPRARVRQVIREMRAKCDEFEEFLEAVSA